MTITEAARYAQKNPETLRRWIRSGKLPARKDEKGDYIIEIDDLRACMSKELMTKVTLGAMFPTALIALTAEEMSSEAKDADLNVKYEENQKEEMRSRLEMLELQRKEVEKDITTKIDELRRLSQDIGMLQASLRD